MKKKVQWGVLGVAEIAVKKVIPAMQHGEWSEVTAIASRDSRRAQQAAKQLGIPKAYGSYEELLADPEIEAIYNPLLNVRDRTGVKIEEAFMVRTHPQWRGVVEQIQAGKIGKVRSISGCFSYNNRDPKNIRNIREFGGGGMMDIGCYLIFTSRFIFGEEPTKVFGVIEEDPDLHTDVLASGVLYFPSGHSVFTCSTQVVPYQKVQIFGTKGRIEVEIPFNAPPDRPCRIYIDDGADPAGRSAEAVEYQTADQYTIQGDLFSESIREGRELPVPLEGSIKNMAIIEAGERSQIVARPSPSLGGCVACDARKRPIAQRGIEPTMVRRRIFHFTVSAYE